MKKFLTSFIRYLPYIKYSARCELKSEVSGSYLNWLWWVLDPLLFMLVYIFIALVVFGKGEPNFPVFVFIGLTIWNFFSKNITTSVTIIRSNKNVITKVYFPKYILIVEKMLVNGFKLFISMCLVAVLIFVYRVPLSLNMLNIVPILLVLILNVFGFSTVILHIGVYLADLYNIIQVVLRLMMYMSGIFYSVSDRVPAPFNKLLLTLNPAAFFIESARRSLLYQMNPNYLLLLIWLLVGIAVSAAGVNMIKRSENNYIKVML